MQRRPLVSLFEILCKYILMYLSLYLLKKMNLLYYFPIHLVKAIPRNPAPIPISHPVWALPNIDPTPAPRNVQPTNTNPSMPQFGRSILHPHPFFTTYAICKLNFLAYELSIFSTITICFISITYRSKCPFYINSSLNFIDYFFHLIGDYFSTHNTWNKITSNGNIKVPSVVNCCSLFESPVKIQDFLNLLPTKLAFSLISFHLYIGQLNDIGGDSSDFNKRFATAQFVSHVTSTSSSAILYLSFNNICKPEAQLIYSNILFALLGIIKIFNFIFRKVITSHQTL